MAARDFTSSGRGANTAPHERGANGPSKKRAPEVLDRNSIEAKALGYLDRFDASAHRLRRILTEFVEHRAQALGVDPAPFMTLVGETLERYQQNGLLDDRRYGTAMARNLVERGVSRQAIRAKLCVRGIPAGVIDEVVKELSSSNRSEVDAARALVKKRKLGNYRAEAERKEHYRKDLGILARAGFDFDTAKRALAVEGADGDEF